MTGDTFNPNPNPCGAYDPCHCFVCMASRLLDQILPDAPTDATDDLLALLDEATGDPDYEPEEGDDNTNERLQLLETCSLGHVHYDEHIDIA